jgi:hypothetical protein
MNTPMIGHIRPIPHQGLDDTNDSSVSSLPHSRPQPGKGAGAITAFKDDRTATHEAPLPGVELLLNLAVQPAGASARLLLPGGLDRTLHGAMTLLDDMARHDRDPIIAQALDLLREDTMLRALASNYRNALQAG